MANIITSPLPDVEIPDLSITDYVLGRADELADQPAIGDATGRGYTFHELKQGIRAFGGGLKERGFGPGNVLAILAPNVPEYAVVFHGVCLAGGTNTTLNPTYTADEIRHQLNDSKAELIVTIEMFLDVAREAIEGTGVTEIITMDGVEGTTALSSIVGEPIDQVPLDFADHVAVMPYSSGTTGLSKGVMLTHRNLVANIEQCKHVLVYEPGEVAIAALPFFHIYGMQVLMNALLKDGVRVITMPRFDFGEALGLIQSEKVTRFYAVPPMVLALAKQPAVAQFDLSSLKMIFSGAAPLDGELANEAAEACGCPVVQGYGMTELSPVSHATPPDGFKVGSSGITVSNTECRLVDADGNDVDPGGRGELWVRGPQVMKGYFGNESATASTIDDDGWLHTGDVAEFDDEGNVYIVDRLKELIKYKGFQVPPAELEGLLINHPKIADCAVIGVPDPEAGELPKAFIVGDITEQEVKDYVASKVASYKQIRIVEFIDEIPKSASGKILRRFLRDGTPED